MDVPLVNSSLSTLTLTLHWFNPLHHDFRAFVPGICRPSHQGGKKATGETIHTVPCVVRAAHCSPCIAYLQVTWLRLRLRLRLLILDWTVLFLQPPEPYRFPIRTSPVFSLSPCDSHEINNLALAFQHLLYVRHLHRLLLCPLAFSSGLHRVALPLSCPVLSVPPRPCRSYPPLVDHLGPVSRRSLFPRDQQPPRLYPPARYSPRLVLLVSR